MNHRYKKGYRLERDIVNYLRHHGHAAIRTPASKTVDVIAWTPRYHHTVIECKVRRADTLYIPKEDVTKLEKFAKAFHATPLIAWRPAHRRLPHHPRNVVLIHPKNTEETTASRKITLNTAIKNGLSLKDLLTDHHQEKGNTSSSQTPRPTKEHRPPR